MKPKLHDDYGNSIQHTIPNPSQRLIDGGSIISLEKRIRIIDLAAKYVSDNVFASLGRASMCLQFSILVQHMLLKEGVMSDIKTGYVKYTSTNDEFEWEHYWVETNSGEVIDCNIDSIIYHPEVPEGIEPYNYWGEVDKIPLDRDLTHSHIFTWDEIQQLEKDDDETLLWKAEVDKEY